MMATLAPEAHLSGRPVPGSAGEVNPLGELQSASGEAKGNLV